MDVRPLRVSEIDRAAGVLADAFLDDPFVLWLFPEHRRRERLVATWTNQLRVVSVPTRHAYATTNIEGVALWAPPGVEKLGFVQQLRMIVPFVRILGRRIPTALKGYDVIRRARPAEPHWYLSTLGVTPSQQRRGFGGALLRPMLERADHERALTYLETFRPDNVPYYERFGFRVCIEDDVPDGGPHMWGMSRLPFAAAG